MDGFLVLTQLLQWLADSFDELPDDEMDGNGSSPDCRLAIQLASCCRYLPSVLEKMRIRLLEGRLRYAEDLVNWTFRNLQSASRTRSELQPLLKTTPRRYFPKEMRRQLPVLAQRLKKYEKHYNKQVRLSLRSNDFMEYRYAPYIEEGF